MRIVLIDLPLNTREPCLGGFQISGKDGSVELVVGSEMVDTDVLHICEGEGLEFAIWLLHNLLVH